MPFLLVSDEWRRSFPGACAGVLVLAGVANPASHSALEKARQELQREFQARFAGADRAQLAALPRLQAYAAYFKRYDKTYHVALQLETVALKGRPLPRAGALVEAMFIAELRNQLLTAGHDLAAIQPPLRLDVTRGTERYTMLNGRDQGAKAGDMCMADRQGIVSTVLYGPDARTRIAPGTRDVLYAVYAPAGVGEEAVRRHLAEIRDLVLRVSPDGAARSLEVQTGGAATA
ncbi:MAG: hypothetical protein ACE147_06185 [Candidatus Methylomirabilales bacterium]